MYAQAKHVVSTDMSYVVRFRPASAGAGLLYRVSYRALCLHGAAWADVYQDPSCSLRPPMSGTIASRIGSPLLFMGGTCLRGAAYVPLVDIHGVRHLDGRFSRSTHAVYLCNFAVTDEEKLDRGQNSHDTQQIGIPTQDTHSHGSSCTGSAK